jgi:molybdate transport system substrate-binding protein
MTHDFRLLRRLVFPCVYALALLCFTTLPAHAADLHVLAAGAVKSVMPKLSATFEQQTGHKVTFVFGSVGDMAGRLESGEKADLIIVTPAGLKALEGKGFVKAGNHPAVGSVGVGLAVRVDATAPDIGTADGLRQALLAARKVIYSDPNQASASIHFATVIERLGIADAVKAKAHVAPNGIVGMQDLAQDKGPGLVLGVTQLTEVPLHPEVKLAGPLPGDLQKITTYGAAVTAKTRNAAAAAAFLAWITNSAAQQTFAAAGFDVK